MEYKMKDIETNINVATAENGDIGAKFYTEDDGSSYIRITIKNNEVPVDFTNTDMTPRLFLQCDDGSIFDNEKLDIILPKKGVMIYKISDYVIRHAGRMNAKLFLENTNDSVHVANFYFTIEDSGLIGPVGKEVQIDTLNSVVEEIMSKNAIGVIDEDFKKRLFDDAEAALEQNIDFKELVDARGNSTSLKERLDSDSQEMEFNIKKLKEKSFYNFLTENSVPLSNNTVSIANDRNLNFNLKFNDTDAIKLNFSKDEHDDFIKFRTADYRGSDVLEGKRDVDLNYTDAMVKTGRVIGSGDNYYATDAGTKVSFVFTGTNLKFRYYTDVRGGLWKVSIDGNFVKNVSTHIGAQNSNDLLTTSIAQVILADNLKDIEHTVVMEFLGVDTSHPVDSPRGWLRVSTITSNPTQKYSTFTYTTATSGSTLKSNLTYVNYDNTMVSGGTLSGSGDNYYATDVGTKITYTFNGTGVKLRYYTDNRGGLWKAYIDGEYAKDVSTHISAQSNTQLLANAIGEASIASNLSNNKHILVLEFVGQDPNYPVTSPRGWLRTTSDTSNPALSYETFAVTTVSSTAPITDQNLLYDSNKEFAFNVTYNNTSNWIPEHNGTGTLFVSDGGSQRLFLDNKEVSLANLDETSFTEAKLLQKLYGVDATSKTQLCEIICVATITTLGVKFNTKVTWFKEVTVNSGYVNMFTINPSFADTLVTSYDTKYGLDVYDNSYVYLDEQAPYSFAAVSSKYPNTYLTCDNLNAYNTLRLAYPNRDGDKYGKGLFALQHRNADLQKVYPKIYTNHTTKPGEQYTFEGYFGFGRLPMAKAILS